MVNYILGAGMVVLLALGAYYDYKTTYVSDAVTIPYAILGVLAACATKHYCSAILATYIILAQIFPKISLLRIISSAIKKQHKNTEAVSDPEEEKESVLISCQIAKLEKYLPFIGTLVTEVCVLCCLIYSIVTNQLSILNVALFSTVLIANTIIIIRFLVHHPNDDAVPATENIEGFGGADILIFAGLLGYYGLISFFGCIVISLSLSLIIHLIYSTVKKSKVRGIPLLPSLFISFPARIIVYQMYLNQFTATFDSLFTNF